MALYFFGALLCGHDGNQRFLVLVLPAALLTFGQNGWQPIVRCWSRPH
jgi:hypothetical protein